MKKNYTVRLEPSDVEELMKRTGAPFTHSMESLVLSFLNDQEFRIIKTEDENVYVLCYKPRL